MKFRTPVEITASAHKLSHDGPQPIFVGSCFSDNIAKRLGMDGFSPISNPGGAMYNPMSVAGLLLRALRDEPFSDSELVEGPRGFHLLSLSTPFSGPDAGAIIESANTVLESLREALKPGAICFLTFGTAFVFEWNENGRAVGNCHKLPASLFTRRRLSVRECVDTLAPLIEALAECGIHTVLTVSPVRHTADSLHGNTLSKATLHLACDELCERFSAEGVSYFPAYEAIIDDLRDYRFTAPDMKHPTEQAADYVYELFKECYFTPDTARKAEACRRESLRSAHRPIL